MRFDVAVVGLGLVGSAALRYLSLSELSVVGIGPDEPDDWSNHVGPFASHYDSGRITRRLDARYEWAVLASRSIEQYPIIEEAAGLAFHHPVGLVVVSDDVDVIESYGDVIDQLALPVTISANETQLRDYVFPAGCIALSEPAPAGFIDPRVMLAAQLTVAEKRGASIHRSFVMSLSRNGDTFDLECDDGSRFHVGRVLVATGPYLNDVLPRQLAAEVVPEAVLLAEVSEVQAKRLADLPSLIYRLAKPIVEGVYLVPPTRYPDGGWYLKMGGSSPGRTPFESAAEKGAWMAGSAADGQLDAMQDVLMALLPGVAFEGFSMKPCLITNTAHTLPYVDEVEDGLFVALGGNGHAAKSADAIGALAVDLLVTGEWRDTELTRESFAAVFPA